jgi:hypothetical protein
VRQQLTQIFSPVTLVFRLRDAQKYLKRRLGLNQTGRKQQQHDAASQEGSSSFHFVRQKKKSTDHTD